MTSKIDIANLALQMIGQGTIADFDEASKAAREIKKCYDVLRKGELEKNVWVFALGKASLAADSPSPDWGRPYSYTLPNDYLRDAPFDPRESQPANDYLRVDNKIETRSPGPLRIRYIRDITDTNLYSAQFVTALAAQIAIAICEPLTQSATKIQECEKRYAQAITRARLSNLVESGYQELDIDEYLSVRL